jgi:cyclohexanone monooxygenase
MRANVKKLDVAIVGAGFAGLYALYKARQNGLRAEVFEAGGDVGGTWYWNRYPGARCDVESHEYSFSFCDEIQQEWRWPQRYSAQPDILRYINFVADKLDLRRDITFNCKITEAVFNESAKSWALKSERGETIVSQFCILAVGCLSLPRLPNFPGREQFGGDVYHTGNWPHETIDFTGRRVGVIGTGSSGIQAIPEIATQAKKLYVFQRTANFSLPAQNSVIDGESDVRIKAGYPDLRVRARVSPLGIASYPVSTMSALEVSEEERQETFEQGWKRGNTSFVRLYKDLLTSPDANATAANFVRNKIRSIVKDPIVMEDLLPSDHYIGTKRLCLDTNYYEIFNRDNVTLVNLRKTPITAVTKSGVQLDDIRIDLDALVFATGYDAVTGPILDIDIRQGNQSLRAKWAQGPRAYLGLMTAGFPNLFTITGPGSPSVLTNMVMAIEQHVEWIFDCMEDAKKRGTQSVEAEQTAEDKWVEHVNEVAHMTLLPTANSWYMGANIPGKPKNFLPYPGGLGRYREICNSVVAADYSGFVFNR